jgi:hypothetical protein
MDAFGGFHDLTIDRNLLPIDQRRVMRIAHGTSIQADATSAYPLLSLAARTGT